MQMRLALVAVLMVSPFATSARCATPTGATMSSASPSSSGERASEADFRGEPASSDARRLADWTMATHDHGSSPFVIIDKIRAKVFVFDNDGRLRGATLALLGMAHGDDTVPGIGSRKLSSIRPEERTTPAGRFVASLGRDLHQDILWIDYTNAISLHRVIQGLPGDHRLERLATLSPLDKRISFGCINVPVAFFEDIVLPTFTGTTGIVYILPETKTLQEVFHLSPDSGRTVGEGTVR
jgi:hypothetical protein